MNGVHIFRGDGGGELVQIVARTSANPVKCTYYEAKLVCKLSRAKCHSRELVVVCKVHGPLHAPACTFAFMFLEFRIPCGGILEIRKTPLDIGGIQVAYRSI